MVFQTLRSMRAGEEWVLLGTAEITDIAKIQKLFEDGRKFVADLGYNLVEFYDVKSTYQPDPAKLYVNYYLIYSKTVPMTPAPVSPLTPIITPPYAPIPPVVIAPPAPPVVEEPAIAEIPREYTGTLRTLCEELRAAIIAKSPSRIIAALRKMVTMEI